MRILVPVKQVRSPGMHSLSAEDMRDHALPTSATVINPYCAVALEQALQMREEGTATEVITVSVSDGGAMTLLQSTIAAGADRALLVDVENEDLLGPLEIARCLKTLVLEEEIDLVLMGKQSVDYGCNQTGQMLSALLGWPQVLAALDVKVESETLFVTRKTDDGVRTQKFQLPGLITVDLPLRENSFPEFKVVVLEHTPQLEIMEGTLLGCIPGRHQEVLEVTAGPGAPAPMMLESVDELVALIKSYSI